MSQRISISVLVVLMCGSVCLGQSSFRGLTPGESTRAQVVRVLGQPVNKVSATLIEYRPQSLTGKIVVQYRKGSPVVERIEMLCQQEASTCDDLIKNLNLHLPLTDAAKVKRQGDKWLAYFGSPLLIVMTGDLTRRTPAQVAFYSPELYEATAAEVEDAKEAVVEALAKLDAQPTEPAELFESAVSRTPTDSASAASNNSLSGRWSGSWKNSRGGSGETSVNINEQDTGTITGDENGWVIENGQRSGNVLIWEYRNQDNGCRDYSVRWEVSSDGKTANGTYKVTDRCEKQTYTGTYLNYRR